MGHQISAKAVVPLFCYIKQKGVISMQYVTYESLFGFFTVIIGIVGLFIAIYNQKK